MMNGARSILSISYDESLLRTREWILKGAGFNVTSAFGFTEAFAHCQNSAFDLAVIGHSIPKKDQAALVRQLRSHNHTRVLSLRRPGDEPLSGVDHTVEASLGAEALVEAVKILLHKNDPDGREH
jgi:DNA-binding response OmpR family regulator